jgi:V/A-type H+-transporting ATPase subunit I
MIIDLEKYLFFGTRNDLDQFFERAQTQGVIQFLASSSKKQVPFPPNIQAIVTAITILRKQPVLKPYTGIYNKPEAEEAVDRILEIKKELEKFQEEQSFITEELFRVSPLGNFSLEDVAFIEQAGRLKFQFFCVKSAKRSKLDLDDDLIYIGTEYDLDYFCTIGRAQKSYSGMVEMHLEKTAPDLRLELDQVKDTIRELELELKEFAGHIVFLRAYLTQELNDYHLYAAKRGAEFPIEESLFSIEGWVPKNKFSELRELTEGLPVAYEKIAIEQTDVVPTRMENKGVNHIGEDLVRIYDIPAHIDRDPSGWVFWFFALFFAIIVGDGGYGLIYLALAVYIKYKFPHLTGKIARIYRLIVVLATSCIIWGVLTASFFGINFTPYSPISKVSLFHYLAEKKADYHIELKDEVYQNFVKKIPELGNVTTGQAFLEEGFVMKDARTEYLVRNDFRDGIFMELTLLIGVIHIGFSLLRYAKRNWSNFGWIGALIGGYLYFPIFLGAASIVHFMGWVQPHVAEKFGMQLLFSGIGVAVVLALIQKRLKGIAEITNAIQIFGDILSYLRLYALALASSILAKTANEMGMDIGRFFGLIVIVLGHTINISLGLMSAVIHGLRLNFIEWYHYCYHGGGKLFNPLRKLTIGR